MGESSFSEREWALLAEHFRLRPAAERSRSSIDARALLDEATCRRVLDALAPVIHAPDRRVTASLLAKRVAFLATGSCLFALSVYDKGLAMAPDNCVIEYGHDGRLWTSALPLHGIVPSGPEPGRRDDWRERLVQGLFAQLLAPLWQTFHRVSGLSLKVLWENTAVRVYSLYERRIPVLASGEALQRAEGDFAWLLQAPSERLGLGYNPLQRFRRPLQQTEAGPVRYRRTCCLYYQATEPVAYCGTCPLLKPRRTQR